MLALRAASVNRHVRGRLIAAATVFAASLSVDLLLRYASLAPELQHQIRTWQPILVAGGVILAGVALVLNPWRADRMPDRFPHIVQDTFVIGLLTVVAMLILQEKMLAMTAAGAVVVGLALQDTLGNLFSGLAIQVEKPFSVGHWVTAGGVDGMVSEITWRATKLRTLAGNLVVMPNSVLARDTITNYSQPTSDFRLDVEVGASYDNPPSQVRAAIVEALREEPLLAPGREVEVLVADFAAFSVNYRVRVWTRDFSAAERLRSLVRARTYYAFKRHSITIPYPVEVQYPGQPTTSLSPVRPRFEAALAAVEIFAPLGPDERGALLERTLPVLFGAGETVVWQGDHGRSMFILVSGEAVVTVDRTLEVARYVPGAFFGEMSLLTGEPRSATVSAVTDCELLEITADAFRAFVMAVPAAVDLVSAAVAGRRAELSRRRAEGAVVSEVEAVPTFVARVRRFLHLADD